MGSNAAHRTGVSYKAWWRHQTKNKSALLALCAGNSLATGEFPSERPVTRICSILRKPLTSSDDNRSALVKTWRVSKHVDCFTVRVCYKAFGVIMCLSLCHGRWRVVCTILWHIMNQVNFPVLQSDAGWRCGGVPNRVVLFQWPRRWRRLLWRPIRNLWQWLWSDFPVLPGYGGWVNKPGIPGFITLRPRQNGHYFADNISNAFSLLKITVFWLTFHSIFPGFE